MVSGLVILIPSLTGKCFRCPRKAEVRSNERLRDSTVSVTKVQYDKTTLYSVHVRTILVK